VTLDPVAAVLDTSAVLAYADGQVAVGELLTMIAEEGRLAAVPASCLVAARAAVTDDFGVEQLVRLTRADAVAVLPLSADEALEVGRLARSAGDAGAGHAAHAAFMHGAYFATTQPKVVVGFLPAGWGVLDLSA
jgi:predicted nucleic acid-binding protein